MGQSRHSAGARSGDSLGRARADDRRHAQHGRRSARDNSFPPKASYETVVLDELMPAVERDFCTWNDRDHRAIGGISRGGFWAYEIALRHPDMFGIVGGHSAAFDAGNAPAAFNPLELALNAPFLTDANLRMYLDNGADDPAGDEPRTVLQPPEFARDRPHLHHQPGRRARRRLLVGACCRII